MSFYIVQFLLASSTETSNLCCFSRNLSLLKMFPKYFQESTKVAFTCALRPACWLKTLFFFFFLTILHVFSLLFQFLMSWPPSMKLLEGNWGLPLVQCPSGEGECPYPYSASRSFSPPVCRCLRLGMFPAEVMPFTLSLPTCNLHTQRMRLD